VLHNPLNPLLDESAVAAMIQVEKKTLQAWRCRGGGPPFIRVGRLVRYRPEHLQAWLESRVHENTSK
jgi:hypothetical protein